MIYLLILLDIILNNYSNFNTYFFILYLYNKSYKYYLITGLILDLIIFKGIYNTLILSIIFILNKLFNNLNKKNIYNYLYINLFNYIIFILISNLLLSNNIKNILFTIGYNLVVNLLFYGLFYSIYIRQANNN